MTGSNEMIGLLAERAKWYREGCPHLEDRDGYYPSGDLARDAADDLGAAIEALQSLTEAHAALERGHEILSGAYAEMNNQVVDALRRENALTEAHAALTAAATEIVRFFHDFDYPAGTYKQLALRELREVLAAQAAARAQEKEPPR